MIIIKIGILLLFDLQKQICIAQENLQPFHLHYIKFILYIVIVNPFMLYYKIIKLFNSKIHNSLNKRLDMKVEYSIEDIMNL